MTYDSHDPRRILGHAELWHGRVTDPGPNDYAENYAAQQRLLAKGSALSGRIEEERELHAAMDIVRLRSLVDANQDTLKVFQSRQGNCTKNMKDISMLLLGTLLMC